MSNHPGRFYKEVWIGLGGVQSAVYATEVSRSEYLTYTTEESEKMEVLELAESLGGDIELAIKQLNEGKELKPEQPCTRKEYIPAQAVDSNFRMADLQGRWKNSFGSPEVEVVRSGHGYRITYSYKTGGQYHDPVISLWWYCIL